MEFTKNVAFTFAARLFQVLFRLLGGMATARFLGPAALGTFSLVQMLTGIAVTLGNLGVNGSIVYYAGKHKDKISRLAANALLLGILQGVLLALLIAAFLPVLQSGLAGLKDTGPLLLAIALVSVPFQLLLMNFNALLQGQNKIGELNKNILAVALLNFILIVVFLALLDAGIFGRLAAYTLGSALGAALAFIAVKNLYGRKAAPDFALARDMVKFGSVINAITIIQFLNYRLDIFLLGYFCTAGEVGQYYVAVTTGEMLWYLPNAVGIVLFPVLAGGSDKNSRLTAVSARNNLFIISLLSLAVFAGAEIIVRVFFSAAYLPAVLPLRVLLPGIVCFSLAKILSPDLINRGKARTIAGISLASLVLNVVLNIVLIPRYGAAGAAAASSVSYICGILLLLWVYCHTTRIGLKDILLINSSDLQGYFRFLQNAGADAGELFKREKIWRIIKRSMDIFLSLVLLVAVLPVMLLIAAAVVIESGRPVLFIQERAGFRGRPFKIYKFRTMLNDCAMSDERRITGVGRFLRASSLDELPQLVNVLKGDMSLVGPRPTLPYQVERYNDRQRKRLEVLPGITGWAQVNHGERLSWAERIEMDLWYIENQSVWLDLKIILMTATVMLNGRVPYVEQSRDEIAGCAFRGAGGPGKSDEKAHKKNKGGLRLKKLVVVGAGGFGREVVQLARQINKVEPQWEITGFVDDNQELHGKIINGLPVLGGVDWLAANADDKYVVFALGEPELKRTVEKRLKSSRVRYATLIHPTAVIGDYVHIGEGSIIAAGTVLTVNIKTGRHVIINLNSCVGHDAVIEDYVTIACCSNIMGEVTVGEGSYVASGVTVRDCVRIGQNSIIGLGAVVVHDLPGDIVATGIPAKVARENTTKRVFK